MGRAVVSDEAAVLIECGTLRGFRTSLGRGDLLRLRSGQALHPVKKVKSTNRKMARTPFALRFFFGGFGSGVQSGIEIAFKVALDAGGKGRAVVLLEAC